MYFYGIDLFKINHWILCWIPKEPDKKGKGCYFTICFVIRINPKKKNKNVQIKKLLSDKTPVR